jgi:hypothetical protein
MISHAKEGDDYRTRECINRRICFHSRIRNEPVEGVEVGQLFHYVVDYDLDGLTDVGSTTRMESPAHAPTATVVQFFVRGTGRGDQFRSEYQKLYDDGIQVALKFLGE